jgi:chaperonin cofactor prefoldin
MMGSGGSVSLLLGDAFMVVSEEEAGDFCDGQVEVMQGRVNLLDEEIGGIDERQKVLKEELYGR